MKQLFYILLGLFITFNLKAQFISAEFGVDGLTCSACSRNVEMSIRKLTFVKDVQMDIDNTKGLVIFKDSSKASVEKIAKAIIDAGFSVRYMKATFLSDSIMNISDNYSFTYNGDTYQFIRTSPLKGKKEIALTFIGKEFLSAKEYKKWKADLKPVTGCTQVFTYYVTL